MFLDHAGRAGFQFDDFNVVMELGSPEAIKGAVGAGLGVAVISIATLCKELGPGIPRAAALDPLIERPFSFVHRKRKFRVSAVEELLRFAIGDGEEAA